MQTVCCICHKTKTRSRWVKPGQFPAQNVSHGYCPRCFRQLMAEVHRHFAHCNRQLAAETAGGLVT